MWVEEVSKSEGRAVGHVTCTEKVADWAFSWIKADQISSPNSLIESGAPERRMKIRGLSTTLFI